MSPDDRGRGGGMGTHADASNVSSASPACRRQEGVHKSKSVVRVVIAAHVLGCAVPVT